MAEEDASLSDLIIHEIPAKYLRSISKPSLSQGWEAIAGSVLTTLCKGDGRFIPVKYLQDGERYELGTVIFKEERSLKDVLLLKRPKARPVCMLENLLVSPEDISCEESTALKRAADVQCGPDVRHIFDGSDVTRKASKRVYFSMRKCKRQVLNRIEQIKGNIIDLFSCDAYGFGIENVYVIHEVLYSQELSLRIVYNDESVSLSKHVRWPLAFRLCKFSVLYESVLGPVQMAVKRFNVRWRPFKRYQVVRTSVVADRERGFGDDMFREERRRRRRQRNQRDPWGIHSWQKWLSPPNI